ncbi:MAG: zf-HC2 domain-containing protein [Verrucomicrobiales bacterium]|nr:zf-HC2 domain-containing protein [Verrucomicrobiales bacterium]
MNSTDPQLHPRRELWADYLYGELPAEQHAQLDDHLRACPDCERQLAQWRQTQAALDAWKLPRRARPVRSLTVSIRWAAAAALVLGLGWLGGRLSAPPLPDARQLRAELEPALKQELQAEFQSKLSAALETADAKHQERLVELVQAWAVTREQDQQTTLALLQQADRQRRADYATLRRDLETVAVVAQDAIGTTQHQLTQLAVNSLTPTGSDRGLPR